MTEQKCVIDNYMFDLTLDMVDPDFRIEIYVLMASRGRLDQLKYIKEKRGMSRLCDTRVIIAAATTGHLRVIQWLRAQNPPCPWNENVCEIAAERGHFEVLKWLRNQNPPCPWSTSTYKAAIKANHPDIAKWVEKNGCPKTSSSSCSVM